MWNSTSLGGGAVVHIHTKEKAMLYQVSRGAISVVVPGPKKSEDTTDSNLTTVIGLSHPTLTTSMADTIVYNVNTSLAICH